MIFKYLIKGRKGRDEVLKQDNQPENVQKVLDYLKMVHQIHHCTDEHTVARLIEQHNLGTQHVPTGLLSSKEVK